MTASYYPTCDTDKSTKAFLRGLFNSTGIDWPPGPASITVNITVRAPASVMHGTTLDYYVEIRNTNTADYSLSPCPDYVEILGSKRALAKYGLNCAPVRHIKSGASVRFEMRLDVPSAMLAGPTSLNWALIDFRIAPSHVETAITIT